jgi:hypothetical protein
MTKARTFRRAGTHVRPLHTGAWAAHRWLRSWPARDGGNTREGSSVRCEWRRRGLPAAPVTRSQTMRHPTRAPPLRRDCPTLLPVCILYAMEQTAVTCSAFVMFGPRIAGQVALGNRSAEAYGKDRRCMHRAIRWGVTVAIMAEGTCPNNSPAQAPPRRWAVWQGATKERFHGERGDDRSDLSGGA